MKRTPQPAANKMAAYLELTKPRILTLVLVSTLIGFFMAAKGVSDWPLLILALIGTGLTAGGAGVLNHYLERDHDAQMVRTQNRPIPSGLIHPNEALMFGIILVLIGSAILVWKVNVLTGFLSLLTAFLYILVYTPMKRMTWLNTSVGSIPGAIPPLGGWAAATGSLDAGAWILFGILYLWQHPHFYAIAWMCREDYKRAGFKMLPVLEPDGASTMRQIYWHLLLLIPISVLPYFNGMMGGVYAFGVLILALGFIAAAIPLAQTLTDKAALLLLKASVYYLPALLLLMVIDMGFRP